MSTSVPPLFILTDTCSDAFHWMLHTMMFYFVMHKTTKDDQQFTTKNQQGKCSIKSFNSSLCRPSGTLSGK